PKPEQKSKRERERERSVAGGLAYPRSREAPLDSLPLPLPLPSLSPPPPPPPLSVPLSCFLCTLEASSPMTHSWRTRLRPVRVSACVMAREAPPRKGAMWMLFGALRRRSRRLCCRRFFLL